MLCLYLHPSLGELLNPWAQISQIYQLKVLMVVRLRGFFLEIDKVVTLKKSSSVSAHG